MKITSLDKENIKVLRIKVTAALNKELAPLGMSVNIGTIRFNPASFRTKLEVKLTSAPESVLARSKPNGLRAYAIQNPNLGDLENRVIIVNGEQYRLEDYTSSRPKFPFSVVRLRGNKRFKMSAPMVRNSLLFKQT